MKIMFSPAIVLMNRLRFPGKFGVMLAILIVTIGFLLASLYHELSTAIGTAENEIRGIQVVKPVLQAVQVIQQHRALAAAVIGGNTALAGRREDKSREVGQRLGEIDAALPAALRQHEQWQAVRGEWAALERDGLRLGVPENIAAHTALVGRLLPFTALVADAHELTLDPEPGSFYLMDTAVFKLPAMLEAAGRLRATGTAALSAQRLEAKPGIALNVFLADIERNSADYKANLAKTAQANPEVAPALKASSEQLFDAFARIAATVRGDILSERFSTRTEDYIRQTTESIDAGYRQLYDTLLPILGKLIDERIDRHRAKLRIELLAAAVGVSLIVYFAVGLYLALTATVSHLGESAARIAGGDLSTRVRLITRDELHEVGGSFNRVADAFNDTIRNVRANADLVLDAAQRTACSSEQIAKASDAQSGAASSMAAAVEETTVSVSHINNNAQEARNTSQRSGELSTQGGRLVQTVVAEMKQIAGVVSESAQSVEDLGKRSDEISAIVGVINDIANQTNLLALNAAIEAARAGDQGRGFAVVADEVRKLAERTTKSTEEIGSMIGAIQSETRAAVDNMKRGVERVAHGVDLTASAGQSMAEIESCATQVMRVVREISEAMSEQSAASGDIARNIETIAQMAEENSAAVGENHATATQLEQLASQLQNQVAQFVLV